MKPIVLGFVLELLSNHRLSGLKIAVLAIFCISKSIKSSPIYEGKSAKSAIFRYAREGEQKEAHSCTNLAHRRTEFR